MRLDFANERIVAVVAHPDDTELLCAGTLARARADGATIALCVACKGDKGQPARPVRDLAVVRRREMRAAAKLLGAKALFLRVGDGDLADTPPLRRKLVEMFRAQRATVVFAHDPHDYHPDHQAASRLTEAATWFCTSRGHRTKSKPLPGAPRLWFMDTLNMHGFAPGFYLDVSSHLELKRQMLACHRSQLVRGSDLPALAELMQRQARARGAQSGVVYAEAFRLAPRMSRVGAW